ncbi:MAG TPA: toast rack family protein [Bryobacteraceae bacterium]|nr:toast rack family protein [Bryobacteraceae bacterium]HUO30945.1 toast rack family protein [Bryobacteraceae bacterium]
MLIWRPSRLAVACASFLLFTGCERDWRSRGISRTEIHSIPLDQSEFVRADLRMGAGELWLRGGSSKLVDAEFSYRRLRMRPELRYDSGHLTVEEPAGFGASEGRYRWDLTFNNDKPLDLNIDFGAGEGHLDLGSLSLRQVNVHMGVGELHIDLRGEPKSNYRLAVHGGVGELTVYLPEKAGIVADVQGGIGDIDARGLEKRDGRYVNAAYEHAKTTVELEIHGGIGAIHLIGE